MCGEAHEAWSIKCRVRNAERQAALRKQAERSQFYADSDISKTNNVDDASKQLQKKINTCTAIICLSENALMKLDEFESRHPILTGEPRVSGRLSTPKRGLSEHASRQPREMTGK